jgi:hypothetical protein
MRGAFGYRLALCAIVAILGSLAPGWAETPAVVSESGPAASPAEDSGGTPRIQFTTLEHDFGQALSGEDLKTVFEFKNAGEGVLVIEKVKGG